MWPQVIFQVAGKSELVLVKPVTMSLEDNHGVVICSRVRMPLLLSYALTVHHAQGMDLKKVIFDMKDLFAEGQLYTALSRVHNFDCLAIINGPKVGCPCANVEVVAWEAKQVWHLVDNAPE